MAGPISYKPKPFLAPAKPRERPYYSWKQNGKTYSMPWEAGAREPTDFELEEFAHTQDNPSMWQSLTAPMSGKAETAGRYLAEPFYRAGEDSKYANTPYLGSGLRGTGAVIESLGQQADSAFTSPLGIATLGGGYAAQGLKGVTPLVRGIGQIGRGAELAGSAAIGGHGLYETGAGVLGGDLKRSGMGLLETAMGGMGGYHALSRSGLLGSRGKLPDLPTVEQIPPAARPPSRGQLGPHIPDLIEPPGVPGGRAPRGPGGPVGPFESPGFVEGEVLGISDTSSARIPNQFGSDLPTSQGLQVLPGEESIFYGGRTGLSRNITDVMDMGTVAETPAQSAFFSSIPERFKPPMAPSNQGARSSYPFVPQTDPSLAFSQPGPPEYGPGNIPPSRAVRRPATGLSTVPDAELARMAQLPGNTAALTEIRARKASGLSVPDIPDVGPIAPSTLATTSDLPIPRRSQQTGARIRSADEQLSTGAGLADVGPVAPETQAAPITTGRETIPDLVAKLLEIQKRQKPGKVAKVPKAPKPLKVKTGELVEQAPVVEAVAPVVEAPVAPVVEAPKPKTGKLITKRQERLARELEKADPELAAKVRRGEYQIAKEEPAAVAKVAETVGETPAIEDIQEPTKPVSDTEAVAAAIESKGRPDVAKALREGTGPLKLTAREQPLTPEQVGRVADHIIKKSGPTGKAPDKVKSVEGKVTAGKVPAGEKPTIYADKTDAEVLQLARNQSPQAITEAHRRRIDRRIRQEAPAKERMSGKEPELGLRLELQQEGPEVADSSPKETIKEKRARELAAKASYTKRPAESIPERELSIQEQIDRSYELAGKQRPARRKVSPDKERMATVDQWPKYVQDIFRKHGIVDKHGEFTPNVSDAQMAAARADVDAHAAAKAQEFNSSIEKVPASVIAKWSGEVKAIMRKHGVLNADDTPNLNATYDQIDSALNEAEASSSVKRAVEDPETARMQKEYDAMVPAKGNDHIIHQEGLELTPLELRRVEKSSSLRAVADAALEMLSELGEIFQDAPIQRETAKFGFLVGDPHSGGFNGGDPASRRVGKHGQTVHDSVIVANAHGAMMMFSNPENAAASILHRFMHEFTHNLAGGEGADYTWALHVVKSLFGPRKQLPYVERIERAISHQGVYNADVQGLLQDYDEALRRGAGGTSNVGGTSQSKLSPTKGQKRTERLGRQAGKRVEERGMGGDVTGEGLGGDRGGSGVTEEGLPKGKKKGTWKFGSQTTEKGFDIGSGPDPFEGAKRVFGAAKSGYKAAKEAYSKSAAGKSRVGQKAGKALEDIEEEGSTFFRSAPDFFKGLGESGLTTLEKMGPGGKALARAIQKSRIEEEQLAAKLENQYIKKGMEADKAKKRAMHDAQSEVWEDKFREWLGPDKKGKTQYDWEKLDEMIENAEDSALARNIVNKHFGRTPNPGAKYAPFIKSVSTLESAAKLSQFYISNIANVVMTGSRANVGSMVKAGMKMFKDYQGALKEAHETGALQPLIAELMEETGISKGVGKAFGIESAERIQRIFSSIAGKHTADDVFAQLKSGKGMTSVAEKRLKELLLEDDLTNILKQSKLTEKQRLTAGNRMAEITQGRAGSIDLPPIWSAHPMMKLATQFKRFAFSQSKNIKNAAKVDPIRLLMGIGIGGAAVGEAVGDTKALLNSMGHAMVSKDTFKEALEKKFWDRGEKGWRLAQNYGDAWALGIMLDAVKAFGRGEAGASQFVVGPALQDIGRFGSSLWEEGEARLKGKKSKGFTEIGRQFVETLPLFGRGMSQGIAPGRKTGRKNPDFATD